MGTFLQASLIRHLGRNGRGLFPGVFQELVNSLSTSCIRDSSHSFLATVTLGKSPPSTSGSAAPVPPTGLHGKHGMRELWESTSDASISEAIPAASLQPATSPVAHTRRKRRRKGSSPLIQPSPRPVQPSPSPVQPSPSPSSRHPVRSSRNPAISSRDPSQQFPPVPPLSNPRRLPALNLESKTSWLSLFCENQVNPVLFHAATKCM